MVLKNTLNRLRISKNGSATRSCSSITVAKIVSWSIVYAIPGNVNNPERACIDEALYSTAYRYGVRGIFLALPE